MPVTSTSLSRLALPALLAAVLAGCDHKAPRVYLEPKEAPPKEEAETPAEDATGKTAAAPAGNPHAPADPHAATAPGERPPQPNLSGILPPTWKDLGAEGMNVAKFQAGEATVSATPLPSMEGKEYVPVNLWRTAMGQAALTNDAALAALTELPIAGGKGKLFDLSGERTDEQGKKIPTRIVTAFLHREGTTWFFKLQGTPESVAPQVAAFKEFLTTVRFEEPKPPELPKIPLRGEAPPAPEPHTPATGGAPPPASTANSAPPAAAPGLPAGWATLPPGPMQAAKFSVPDKDGTKAEVAVSIFPSDTGGTLANVRRWRGQMGLPDADDATVQANAKPLEGGPKGAIVVELANGDRGFVGAIVPRGSDWYFYKLVGGAPAVASARDSFIIFARAQ